MEVGMKGYEGVNKSTHDPSKCESRGAAARVAWWQPIPRLIITTIMTERHSMPGMWSRPSRKKISSDPSHKCYNFGIRDCPLRQCWVNEFLGQSFSSSAHDPVDSTGLGLGWTETKWAIGCHHRSERSTWPGFEHRYTRGRGGKYSTSFRVSSEFKIGCKEEFRLQFKWVIQSMHQNVQDTLVSDVPCIFHAIIFIIWTFMELKELLLLICISQILFCPNLESEATTDSTRDSGSGNTIRARPVF